MNINEKETIWMEKYRPTRVEDIVLPESIKSKFQKYANNEDVPNLGLWSANPGCVLPGTNITVERTPIYRGRKHVMEFYDLRKKDYAFLKKYVICKRIGTKDYIDLNSISTQIIKVAKSSSKYKQYMKFDKNFYNKYLKFSYWLTKLDLEEAYDRTKALRKPNIIKYFLDDFSDSFFDNFKSRESILKCRLKLLYDDVKIEESSRNINFWIWRGYSEEEAKEKIKLT